MKYDSIDTLAKKLDSHLQLIVIGGEQLANSLSKVSFRCKKDKELSIKDIKEISTEYKNAMIQCDVLSKDMQALKNDLATLDRINEVILLLGGLKNE